jgi:O-antigen/teichoic acid export membrane protein
MATNIAGRKGMRGSHSSSLLRNGLYNIGGQSVRNAAGLITIPLLIRVLGIREYGVWSLAYSVLALMTMAETGISVAAATFLAKDLATDDVREADRTLTFVLVSATAVALVLGLFLWFVGPLIAQSLGAFHLTERADAGRALHVAGIAVSLLILQGTLVGVEQAFDRYAVINVLDLSQSLLANAGLIVVAWWGGRTVALMKWQIVACAVLLAAHCCVVFRLLRGKGLSLSPRWGASKARQIFRFSVATWASTLGTAAFGQCDRLIVGGVLGAPALGFYSAITSIASKINSFSGTVVQPLVPSLSREIAARGPVESRLRQGVRLNALIAVEAGIFLFLLADRIMPLIVPGATLQSILGLQVAALIYALYSFNAPGYYVLFSVGEAQINAVVVLTSGIASLGLIFAGARHFGLLGAIAGNAGYLGTLFLIVRGLRRVGVTLRDYFAWTAFPFLGVFVSLVVGVLLGGFVWWRALFVVLQAALFMFWFLRDLRELTFTKLGLERFSET